MAVTLPQLVKPFATDFLVDFLENIGHGTCPSASSRSALCLRRTFSRAAGFRTDLDKIKGFRAVRLRNPRGS
jgi:hypothetical protein